MLIFQGTLPFIAIQLLMAMPLVVHRYYHDLESLFYVLCYICCVCAGPNGTFRKDFDIFDTDLKKWFGKRGQSEVDIGKAKRETVDSDEALETSILTNFHSYFDPLKPYITELRWLAIPMSKAELEMYRKIAKPTSSDSPHILYGQNSDVRDRAEVFNEYKSILRKAYERLPDEDPPSDNDAGEADVFPPNRAASAIPMSENLHSRLVDIPRDDPVRKSQSRSTGGVEDVSQQSSQWTAGSTAASSTCVEGLSGSPPSAKRKHATFDHEDDDDSFTIPDSPTPGARKFAAPHQRDVRLNLLSASQSLQSRGTPLASVEEEQEPEGPNVVGSPQSATKKQKTV